MEVEAKLRVPNRAAHRELLRLRTIAGYTIVRLGRVEVVDRYFDTADGRLLDADYSCRLRTQGSTVIATLKGLGSALNADGLHRRDEREIRLPSLLLNPADWPPSDARQLALQLTRGAPLQPLFDLNQSRYKADLMQGSRRIGEWSLDEVRAVVGQRPAFYYELEIELGPEGEESDLARVSQVLIAEHKLTPEPSSKFVRGLQMLRSRGTAVEGGLSDEERDQLRKCQEGDDPELARRAGAVLGWSGGLPTREIVARTGLSSGRVRFWLREFRTKRMGIFAAGAAAGEPPDDDGQEPPAPPAPKASSAPGPARKAPSGKSKPALPVAAESPAPKPPAGDATQAPSAIQQDEKPAPPAPAKAVAAAPAPPKRSEDKKAQAAAKEGLPTLADFAGLHGVQAPRARYVADNAETLFDALRKVHDLPRKRRRLLKAAALLATVGAAQDAGEPERAGRDLILAQPIHGISTDDRLELACIVALQREKMKPSKEPALEALEPKRRKEAIVLASLLQVASALTYSDAGGTRMVDPECKGSGPCQVLLEGPAAEGDARRANAKARYWREHLKHDLSFAAVQPAAAEAGTAPAPEAAPAEPADQGPGPVPELPPVQPDEPMAEAGRKVMFTHYMKMLANEDGTRDGVDIEFLHDMRVATRRLRAAYRVFEPYYERKAVAKFNKELRQAGAALGAVRDLDVLIEKAQEYEAAQPPEKGLSLAPLIAAWGTQREEARRTLLDYLDGQAYQEFVEDFRTFLLTPGQGAKEIPPGEPVAHQVRHVIPRLIMERYELVRAYEAVLPDAPPTTYHALRIDCKRLRYALEFFSRLLGPEAPGVIKQVTALQELLGAMQDAHVAEGLIVEFISNQRSQEQHAHAHKQGEAMPGVEAYLLTQQQIQADLRGVFAGPWAAITGPDFRRSLGVALATP